MKRRKAENFVDAGGRTDELRTKALMAAQQFRRLGVITVAGWRSRRVLGAVVYWTAQPDWAADPANGGPVTVAQLREAGLSLPEPFRWGSR